MAVVMDSPGMANVMLPMVVMPPPMAASEPVQKSSTQAGSPGYSAATSGGHLGAHQVHVRVDAAGKHQQAAGVDLALPGHGPAELGDPAAGDADVGLLAVTGRHDGAIADNKVIGGLRHPGILTRRRATVRAGPSGVGDGCFRLVFAGWPGGAADGLALPWDPG